MSAMLILTNKEITSAAQVPRHITLAARGLEEQRNFKELLTKSVGRVHFS
jgi:hypothetical protein